MTKRLHELPFGAHLLPNGQVRFRLWAPAHQRIGIALNDAAKPTPMLPFDQGWHELVTYDAKLGTRYQFVLPNSQRVPDPASRYQPDDVHGASEVVDPTQYEWHDGAWRGRAWETAVLYELHIGAFTPQGTFRAAIDKLDHLVTLGITAIQIMPIAEFPGRRNWGYDGVLLFAPDASYGRPDDFKALIDAAHAHGLMVILDVVYNHFGPDSNYLANYAPDFFSKTHHTPWGAAINYDGSHCHPVREFMIHNALYWLEEFHLDGLRLDAVHAILDDSAKPLLIELAERVRVTVRDRPVHLLLENENNESHLLKHDRHGGQYTAQWNDDVHHVLHTAVTHESNGYYQGYHGDTHKLGRALAEGFAFQGELMPFRRAPRGEVSTQLPPTAFVAFIQNHDQIGNRAFGERLSVLAQPAALRAIAATYLLLPQIPMLFMGEEWCTRRPFTFFCDFDAALAETVRSGRRNEFKRFPEFKDAATRERIPDPQAEATFTAAKLDWNELADSTHAEWCEWYRRILHIRHRNIVPLLPHIEHAGAFTVLAPGSVHVNWQAEDTRVNLLVNLSDRDIDTVPALTGRVLWQEGTRPLASWSVCCWLDDSR